MRYICRQIHSLGACMGCWHSIHVWVLTGKVLVSRIFFRRLLRFPHSAASFTFSFLVPFLLLFFLPSFYPESTRVPTATPTKGHFETLLMSSQDLPGSLKRPRSTSRPPSPSSGSSPKRAASEDPFPSSSDSGRLFDHLITDNGGMVAASSPLRQDIGDNESNKSWVELTQQVKLGSDGEEDMKGDITLRADGEPTLVSQEIWKERNNELLGVLIKYWR